MDTTPKITEMHLAFLEICGIPSDQCTLFMDRFFIWERWMQTFTVDDLRLVVAHTRQFNARQSIKYQRAVTFKMIENLPKFQSWLEEARTESRANAAMSRKPAQTERAKILEATGRPMTNTAPATTPAQVMRESKAFEEFRRWKAEFQKGAA